MMKRVSVFFVAVLVMTACDKFSAGDFSGIYVYDEQGSPLERLGDEDGDWGYDDQFNGTEDELFLLGFSTSDEAIYNLYFQPDSSDNATFTYGTYFMGYPTLPTEKMHFVFDQGGRTAFLQLVIVDKSYEPFLVYQYQADCAGRLTFDLGMEDLGLVMDRLYRIYYRIIVDDEIDACGHGDFIYTADPGSYF